MTLLARGPESYCTPGKLVLGLLTDSVMLKYVSSCYMYICMVTQWSFTAGVLHDKKKREKAVILPIFGVNIILPD